MNTDQFLINLTCEYNSNVERAALFFDKWIDTGDSIYKEKELMHVGSAHAI